MRGKEGGSLKVKRYLYLAAVVIFGLMVLVTTGCSDSDDVVTEANFVDDNWASADIPEGGKLYDKWWKVNGGTEPSTDFDPLWSTQTTNTRTGSTTWRCKECHGWDKQGKDGAYGSGSHFTGFIGVFAGRAQDETSKRQAIFDALADAGKDHDFSAVLSDYDRLDLTKLIVDSLIDYKIYIDYATKAGLGDVTNGGTLYAANCAVCHGADGTALNFGSDEDPVYVGTISNDNPWETLHKIRFGHPGSSPVMPSMVENGLTADEQADILTFAQTLPKEIVGDASIARGGRLYDKWWKVNGGTEPTTDFDPLWSTQTTNTRTSSDTWRCKECHGWDKQGKDGAYGSGSHFTGFVGVWDSRTKSSAEIVAALTNAAGNHDFSSVLDSDDRTDLANLITQGLVDYKLYIDYATKAGLGDATEGGTLFAANCALCHGADGTALNFGSAEDPVYIGTLSNDNPWETFHKIRFGHPGSSMPSMVEKGLTTDEQADILTFAQTLPKEIAFTGDVVRGGLLYDKWWVVNARTEPTTTFDPLWSTQTTNTRTGSTTWRCKECHGWDKKGKDGAYDSTSSHFTGFVGVWDSRTKSSAQILAALTNAAGDHDFAAVLSNDDRNDLTKLIKEGLIDYTLYINYATKAGLGDASNGGLLYGANCALCHGADGKNINFGSAGEPVYIGTLANDNPWETLHKIRFGHPGSSMPSMVKNGLTTDEQADILTYAQTLATTP